MKHKFYQRSNGSCLWYSYQILNYSGTMPSINVSFRSWKLTDSANIRMIGKAESSKEWLDYGHSSSCGIPQDPCSWDLEHDHPFLWFHRPRDIPHRCQWMRYSRWCGRFFAPWECHRHFQTKSVGEKISEAATCVQSSFVWNQRRRMLIPALYGGRQEDNCRIGCILAKTSGNWYPTLHQEASWTLNAISIWASW